MAKDFEQTPMGCAASFFGAEGAASFTGAEEEEFSAPENDLFYRHLLQRAGELNLTAGHTYRAWELTRLAGAERAGRKQRTLLLLILALQAMTLEGSTRLPLAAGGHLSRVLHDLQTPEKEKEAVSSLLCEAETAAGRAGEGGLANIFGKGGDYRPLIFAHNSLYMQKLYTLEERVGKLLSERLSAAGGRAEMGPDTASGAAPVQDRAVLTREETLKGGKDINQEETLGGEETFDQEETHSREEALIRGEDCKGEEILKRERVLPLEAALAEVFASPPGRKGKEAALDERQQEAVRTALQGRLAVVSGRPGSGKTSIVASILRVVARTGQPPLTSVALAAPTGKAADRMRQAVSTHLAAIEQAGPGDLFLLDHCPPATTLHRLLGYSPRRDRFRHNEGNPLPEQLVIVDESSMMDLYMIDRLLRALRPEANLVLLGDADQLPSIEAGAVLRDLCRSPKAREEKKRVIVLEKSYRAKAEDAAGKQILAAARAINEGRLPAAGGEAPVSGKPLESGMSTVSGEPAQRSERPAGGEPPALATRKTVAEIKFSGVEHLVPGDEEQRTAFFERWFALLREGLPALRESLAHTYRSGPAGFTPESRARLGEMMAHFEKFKILCATRLRAGGSGSDEVNAWFFGRWKDYLGEEGLLAGTPSFLVGQPVLMTRNDYSLRLYNGDSGLVLKVGTEGAGRRSPTTPMAVFPRAGSFVAYPLEALRGRLDGAWATTVHKAQGSECAVAALMLPPVYVRPLTRELLYTALTRAKKSVVIVGPREILEQGISQTLERASGLADMIS